METPNGRNLIRRLCVFVRACVRACVCTLATNVCGLAARIGNTTSRWASVVFGAIEVPVLSPIPVAIDRVAVAAALELSRRGQFRNHRRHRH